MKQSDPIASPGTGGDATDIQTQITILKSDSLRDRVLAKLGTSAPAAPEPARLLEQLGLTSPEQDRGGRRRPSAWQPSPKIYGRFRARG